MAITLQDLRMLEVIAREGNLSRAAASLNLTQPALSWAVKKLESELGTPLFHRTKKGVIPTRSGTTFISRTKDLIAAWEFLKQDLHEEESQVRGRFTLGVHPTLGAHTLPKFAPKLLANFPLIELQLFHDLSRHISQGVIDYRYDYGIVVNPPQHLDLTLQRLYTDRIQLWIHDQPTRLQDPTLEDALWLCNPDMVQTEGLMQKVSQTKSWKTRRTMYTTDLSVIAAMVASGGGIGLLPASFATSYPTGNLIPLPGTPFEEDTICLAWRGEAQKSAASQIVRKVMIESLRQKDQTSMLGNG